MHSLRALCRANGPATPHPGAQPELATTVGDSDVVEQASIRALELGRIVDNHRHAGVKALWIKVIVRAVFDWVTYRNSDDIRQLKLAQSAATWLFQPSELFNGFENVCFYLDLDPTRVRGWASNVTPDQVVKIEHLEREPSQSFIAGRS